MGIDRGTYVYTISKVSETMYVEPSDSNNNQFTIYGLLPVCIKIVSINIPSLYNLVI